MSVHGKRKPINTSLPLPFFATHQKCTPYHDNVNPILTSQRVPPKDTRHTTFTHIQTHSQIQSYYQPEKTSKKQKLYKMTFSKTQPHPHTQKEKLPEYLQREIDKAEEERYIYEDSWTRKDRMYDHHSSTHLPTHKNKTNQHSVHILISTMKKARPLK